MEFMSLAVQSSTAWIITVTLLVVGICWSFFKSPDARLPPGPFSWPIVGSLFSLRLPLHHHFTELAKRYGPVVYLKIGMVPYVVVNNPEMAKEVLKVHDLEFAYRPDTHYNRHFSFDYNDLGFAPYGEPWRKLRRVASIHLFSSARLNATALFRKSEMEAAIRQLCNLNGRVANLKTLLGELNSNDMISAGLETSTVTLEWAMAEVMNNPQVMLIAQEEIDKVVGKTRLVHESDLPKLPYIQAVVKETLRLHPAAPVGVPHVNPNAATIAGFKIPAKCKVLVNIWAIGRDPAHWTEPEEFKPERFLESDFNVTGQHFELIPFSAGRRICAGYPLALRSIPFVLATLLQAFDWSIPPGQSTINMNEEEGLALCKLSSELIAAASPRLDESVYASM